MKKMILQPFKFFSLCLESGEEERKGEQQTFRASHRIKAPHLSLPSLSFLSSHSNQTLRENLRDLDQIFYTF